jgi:basic membrane protein A
VKKVISLIIVLAMVLPVLSGCGQTSAPSAGSSQAPAAESSAAEASPPEAGSSPAATPTEDGLSIALILATGGLGDRSLNDSAYNGLMECQEQFGATVQYVEPRETAEFEGHQREFAKSGEYDIIVTIGFDQADALSSVAAEYPEQKFIAIDAQLEGLDNVLSMTYKDNEKMFLQGVFAANTTTTKKVGLVGGMDIPLINAFIAGYMAGIAYVDPTIEVVYKYVGSWSDANTAKELALSMYAEGCDIVVAAAGGSGLGVYAAAEEVEQYAIGVDSNQIPNSPEHIVSNAIREVGNAAIATVGTYVDGTFQGGWVEYGLKEGVVGYTFEGAAVPPSADVVSAMEAAKAAIIAGEISVPYTIEEAVAYVESR